MRAGCWAWVYAAALVSCNGILGLDTYRPCTLAECDASSEAEAGACALTIQPGTCCPTAPFNAPVRLVLPINTVDESDLRFAGDPMTGTGAVFKSTRAGGLGREDIWFTSVTAPSVPATFSNPVDLAATVNSSAAEFSPSLSADGKTLVFNSDRNAPYNEFHLYIATGAGSGSFNTPTLISNVTEPIGVGLSDIDPSLVTTSGGLVLYFASERLNKGSQDIFRSSQLTDGTWSSPAVLAPLTTPSGWNTLPTVTPDEHVIYFQSDRGPTHSRIFMATAAQSGGTFDQSSIHEVAELNDPSQQQGPAYITSDACTLYFSRTQTGSGPTAVWVATRSP